MKILKVVCERVLVFVVKFQQRKCNCRGLVILYDDFDDDHSLRFQCVHVCILYDSARRVRIISYYYNFA